MATATDRRMRALVFDDEPDIREMFRLLFQTRGYEVLTFADPSEFCDPECHACPLCSNERCADVMIVDVKMPVVNGIDFMSCIEERGCHVPRRALMSGYWTNSSLDGAKRLGCHIFVKPMGVGEIFAWLDEGEDALPPAELSSARHCGT